VLTSGSQVERAIKKGEIHRYSIHAEAGQLISLHLESDGVETTLAVTDPSGKEQDRIKSLSGPEGPVLLLTIAGTTGEYTARVSVQEGDVILTGGRYRLFVELRAPVDRDSKVIAAQRATIAAQDLFDKRDPRTAIGFESAGEQWEGIGEKYNEGTCLLMAGLTRKAMADPAKAMKLYERALETFRGAGSARMEAYALNNIGQLYYSLENVTGALDKALDYESQALDLMTGAGDRRGQTLALMNLALAYVHSGQNEKASENLQRALPILTEIGDKAREANALNTLGGIYDSLAEPEKAVESYRRSLKLVEEGNNDLVRAYAFNNLGVEYSNLGDYTKALDYYNKAIPLLKDIAAKKDAAKAHDAKNTEASALDNVGFIQISIGNIKQALVYYKSALELHRAAGSPLGEAATLEDIGYANVQLNNPGEAALYYNQALDLARRIGLRQREANVLNKLGYLYISTGQNEKALQSFHDALPIAREIGITYKEAEALQGVATVKRSQGDLDGARQDIESALTAIESLRSRVTSRQLQASYLANKEDAYEFYIDLLMQLDRLHPSAGYGALALQASERARARSLLDTLSEAHADIPSGMDPNLLKEARLLQAELNHKAQDEALPANTPKEKEQRASLERQIEDLLSEYDQVEAEMRSRNPHYADLVAPHSLDLADIQKSVDAGTVLLEYALGTSRSYLWVVTPDSFHSFELPAGGKLEAEARNLYSLLTARDLAVKFETPEEKAARVAKADEEYRGAAAKLSQEILGPVAGQLGRKRLVVVAQGALQYIPFAALPDPSRQSGAEPLVVSHEILTLPSASVLAVLRGEVSKRKPAPK
ncbi:MAG: tetratricopeptide repeat protein, partial [Blastocatellia bacterium]